MQESFKGDRLLEIMKRSRVIVPGGEESCGAHLNVNGTLTFSLLCTHFLGNYFRSVPSLRRYSNVHLPQQGQFLNLLMNLW